MNTQNTKAGSALKELRDASKNPVLPSLKAQIFGGLEQKVNKILNDHIYDALAYGNIMVKYTRRSTVANYMSSCRSNYFKVGRPREFQEWLSVIPDIRWEAKESPDSPNDMYGMLYVDNPDGGGWPCWMYGEDENGDDTEIEIDIYEELAEFLAPGEVAVLQEVGAEKLRYLYGQAVAIRWDGEIMSININDIFDKIAEDWNLQPSTCDY